MLYETKNKVKSRVGPISRLYHETSYQQVSPCEEELLVEFELERLREKTKILEERLHNKEIFIKEMKLVQ